MKRHLNRVYFRKKSNSLFTNSRTHLEKIEQLNFLKRRLRNAIQNEQTNEVEEILTNRSYLNHLNRYYVKNFNGITLDQNSTNDENQNYYCFQEPMETIRERSNTPADNSEMDTTDCESKNFAISHKSRKTIFKRYHGNHSINWSHLPIDKSGNNALHFATHLNRTCMIDILLDSGYFNIEDKTQNDDQNTPLMIACDDASLDMINLLISRGADVNYENRKNRTPLIIATESKSPFDYHMIDLLLSKGADVNGVTSNGNTVLLSATKFGDRKLMEYLVKLPNININCTHNDGATPLMRASYLNFSDNVSLLIENGAEIEAKNKRKETALYIASFRGYIDVVKLLVEKFNANVNNGDCDGDTPLSVACYENQAEVVSFLLRNGANVNIHGVRLDTPLHVAVSNCDLSVVKELIQFGAKVDIVNKDNETPLHIVTRQNKIETLDFLLEHAKEIDICSNFGQTPFKNVIEKIQIEKLPLGISMIKAGCDVNKKFNNINDEQPNESPFVYLFKLSKSKFKFYQLIHLSDENGNINNDNNNNNYIILSEIESTPIRLYIRLIELILLAGYRLTFDDYKLYDHSWLSAYLKNTDIVKKNYLDQLFLSSGLRSSRKLVDLCRIKVRKLLRKPLNTSIDFLQIPIQLKSYLNLD
jgi:ankyrin repeat protein